jgi:hypothetical protein
MLQTQRREQQDTFTFCPRITDIVHTDNSWKFQNAAPSELVCVTGPETFLNIFYISYSTVVKVKYFTKVYTLYFDTLKISARN